MVGMNTVNIDERERQYFALLDKINLQRSVISRMRESAQLRLLDVDDFDEQDILAAQLDHDIEIEERILAELERQMRLL